jgi:DNA-binding MarR family transcriptional regulator
MNAMTEPVGFQLPKRPKVKEKEPPPDQRKVAVLPIRAVFDQQMTPGALHVLAALCSYCNRAGITWVSQTRLADELNVSRQAVTNQLAQLRKLGYVEIVKKGFRGERCNTLRVVFDQAITAEDAIAMTSNKEDTRPPAIREEQERQMNQEVDREGLRRIAQLVAGAIKQPTKPKEYRMPTSGDTPTVKKMKEEMAKARTKRSKPVDKSTTIGHPPVSYEGSPEVSNEPLHRQPIGHSGVSHNTREHNKRESIGKVLNKHLDCSKQLQVVNNLNTEDSQRVCERMTPDQAREAVDLLLPAFQAEGITPSSRVLADAILQMHRDTA